LLEKISTAIGITTADPKAIATGMKIAFAVAAILIVVALAIARRAFRNTPFAWRVTRA